MEEWQLGDWGRSFDVDVDVGDTETWLVSPPFADNIQWWAALMGEELARAVEYVPASGNDAGSYSMLRGVVTRIRGVGWESSWGRSGGEPIPGTARLVDVHSATLVKDWSGWGIGGYLVDLDITSLEPRLFRDEQAGVLWPWDDRSSS